MVSEWISQRPAGKCAVALIPMVFDQSICECVLPLGKQLPTPERLAAAPDTRFERPRAESTVGEYGNEVESLPATTTIDEDVNDCPKRVLHSTIVLLLADSDQNDLHA
jgi:hypothetical protein